MHATAGDSLHLHSRTIDQSDRTCQVLEVRGPNGGPPYLVRFDDGHESLIFPGPDATVHHSDDDPD
jgi:hypothetical protein